MVDEITSLRSEKVIMVRGVVVFLVTLAAWLVATEPAQASSDYDCTPVWTMTHPNRGNCNYMAVIGPGNDTRVNLALLMMDAYPARPLKLGSDADGRPLTATALFDWGELSGSLYEAPGATGSNYSYGDGSRCISNDSGTEAFTAAVTANKKLSAAEKTELTAYRSALKPDCETLGVAAAIGANSPVGLNFVTYLRGVEGFYGGNFVVALRSFSALNKAEDPWLRETGLYMIGRVELNRAQVGAFGEYGDFQGPDAVDKAALAKAEVGFRAYLKAYPQGRYAVSARGLLRRVFWFAGDQDKLAAEYEWQFRQATADQNSISIASLVEEIDDKLLSSNGVKKISNLKLQAVVALLRMRSKSENDVAPISRADLDNQRAAFAGNPDLHTYLLAAHAFYVAKKPADVLRLIPDAARQDSFSYLQFSRQALRGMALDAVKDPNARGFWLEMINSAKPLYQRPAAELGLALHEERNNGLERVFATGSPVRDRFIREILLQNIAGPKLLKKQVLDIKASRHERDVALFALLYKQVTRGAYADFASDVSLVPRSASSDGYFYDLQQMDTLPLGIFKSSDKISDFGCQQLPDVATVLAKSPQNSYALLCLGEFMRLNGFDDFMLDRRPTYDQLGGTASLFPGKSFSRLELYKGLITNPKTPPTDKAYALYRAVNCYAPSGTNSCSGTEVPVAQRKAWFNRLKIDYPTSRWAQALPYYW